MPEGDGVAPIENLGAQNGQDVKPEKSCAEILREYYAYRYELIKEKYEQNEYNKK